MFKKSIFDFSDRQIVKILDSLMYRKNDPGYYRIGGVPMEEFRDSLVKKILKHAVSGGKTTQRDEQAFKKMDSRIEHCIERGFIKKDNASLKITEKGERLLSIFHYLEVSKEWAPLFISLLALVFSIYFSISNTMSETRLNSANFMVEFNSQLRNGKNSYSKLIYAIDGNNFSLEELNANFSTEYLDNYLMMWELLDNAMEHKLIAEDMAYDAFSYDIEKAYCNSTVKKYIQESRVTDVNNSDLYGGFTTLARRFMALEQHPFCQINY